MSHYDVELVDRSQRVHPTSVLLVNVEDIIHEVTYRAFVIRWFIPSRTLEIRLARKTVVPPDPTEYLHCRDQSRERELASVHSSLYWRLEAES